MLQKIKAPPQATKEMAAALAACPKTPFSLRSAGASPFVWFEIHAVLYFVFIRPSVLKEYPGVMVEHILLWSAPLLIIPISFLVNRFLPLKTARYYTYAAVLAVAFFLNLFHVSFWNEIIDTGQMLLVNFIFADFFWNILKIKKRIVVVWMVFIGVLIYGSVHFHWLYAGPGNAWKLWNPGAVTSYALGDMRYAVKDRDLFYIRKPARELSLVRRLGKWPLEKQIYAYRTPMGFSRTKFSYTWSETEQGARVDLRTAGYTLWTMGEGF